MAFTLWSYNPSSAAALVFAILYAFITVYHAVVCFRRRAWHFIPIVVGGLCMFPKSPLLNSHRG